MQIRFGVLAFLMFAVGTAHAGTIVKVTGIVVDSNGEPIAGAHIAEFWHSEQGMPLAAEQKATSDVQGRFSLELELYRSDTTLMAMDAGRTVGGRTIVSLKSPEEPVRIELNPLAELRFRYVSEQADRKLQDTFLMLLSTDKKQQVGGARSGQPNFFFKLPAGRYVLRGSENRHETDEREITLEPGQVVDLGEITLSLSKYAQLIGKPAPTWHFTDARGVSKEIQPADFKGKWVVLEFWGYWCGPCIQRGLPGWIDFIDDHAIDQDKFVVLSVHSSDATDFTMLDEKLAPIIRRTWRGRSLPFPILLDTSGQTVEDYGVKGWPTAILIDPDGLVVDVPWRFLVLGSWACEDFLASKLTPLPAEKRLARSLDRVLGIGVDETQTLAENMDFISKIGRVEIRLDADELSAAGLSPESRTPLTMSGGLTMRAWLNLTLSPLGLTYVADGDSLRIVRRSAVNLQLSQPSARQNVENGLVLDTLSKKISLDIKQRTLKQLLSTLEEKTNESFLIDPTCRKTGTINPESLITATADDEPLSSALTRWLAPLNLTFAVENEAVIVKATR